MNRSVFIFILSLVCFASVLSAQQTQVAVEARVAADSGKTYVEVENVYLDFVFAGYGIYLPSEYPVLTEIPLEIGERVRLDKIAEASFRGERVHWKEFVEPEKRNQYKDVDADGYRNWSGVEIIAKVRDWEGRIIRSRVKRPELADVYLKGKTSRGNFSLQLDQENGKVVHVIFSPSFVMQCSDVATHIFPNVNWKFCPHCSAKLKRVGNKKAPKSN